MRSLLAERATMLPVEAGPDPKAVGQRIKQARLERGLSQADLVRQASFSKSSLSNYERGIGAIPYLHLNELERLLGKSRVWLLHGIPQADLSVLSPAELAELRETLAQALAESEEARRLNERILTALRLAGIEIPLDIARGGRR